MIRTTSSSTAALTAAGKAGNDRPAQSAPEIFKHEVDGRALRVARWRSANGAAGTPPLLFLTGIGANLELLAPFLSALRGREVVTFDVPGVGASPPSRRPYRLRAMARIADKLMTDLGHGRIDVMGLSWGGMLAQQVAHQSGDRVARLVLGATSPGSVMVPGKLSALARMLMPQRYHQDSYLDRHFATIYGGSREGAEDMEARMTGPARRGYVHQLLAVAGWTSLPFLPLIKAPTLVLMGAEDRLVPVANGYLLKILMRDARLEIVNGAGHLFALTHRTEVADLVGDFLDRRSEGGLAREEISDARSS